MANEQTSVPLFVADTILTAAQQNISAGTGVPVFATTVTRDAAFGGANKALAEGQLCYLSSTNVVQYYDGAAWATVGPAAASGLTLVSATTIGTTVASVTVSSAFSATYDNYLISVAGGVASGDIALTLTLGATVTGYYRYTVGGKYDSATVYGAAAQNAAGIVETLYGSTDGLSGSFELMSPNKTTRTTYFTKAAANSAARYFIMNGGYIDNATAYTAFTLTCASGTISGGTIRVYGYQNS